MTMVMDAKYWEWEQMAKEGDEAKQYTIGNMYFNGEGVPQSILKGYKYILLSAKQGYPIALEELGMIYYDQRKYKKAIPLLKEALKNYEPIFEDWMSLTRIKVGIALSYEGLNDYKNAWDWYHKIAKEADCPELKKDTIEVIEDYINKVVKFSTDPTKGIEFIKPFETS